MSSISESRSVTPAAIAGVKEVIASYQVKTDYLNAFPQDS